MTQWFLLGWSNNVPADAVIRCIQVY